MKKKKGFTLIELLAVIVVLSVILIIAVPKILDVIENAEKQAYKESAELMAHTAQIQYQTKEVTGSAPVIPDEGITYTFTEGVQSVSGNYDLLKFKGDKPYSGTITLTKDKKVIIEKLVSKNKKWCAIKEANEKQARVGRSTDPEFACIVEADKPIEDKVACELATNDDKTEYYIDSPCDLYEFSHIVNSGENFSGKVVKVRNNLDMDLEKINADSDLVKKIKDNYGTTEFLPIGKYGNPFSGTFDGGAKTISNLTIDQPNLDYVGLFGYISGISSTNKTKIYGVVLDDAKITGRNVVGGFIGYYENSAYTEFKEILINDMTVKGNDNVSAFVGYAPHTTVAASNILIKDATIEGKGPTGLFYGHLIGSDQYIKSSIVENAKVTKDTTGTVYATPTSGAYYSNNVVVKETNITNGYDPNAINDINFYEGVGLDTWIGSDDDSGYYFDYDKNNNIILKNIENDPITFNLSKDENGYYLIKNEKDWKIASSKPTEKYKIVNDLDFSKNKYYMLGSSQSTSRFSGTLNGNDKLLSNITINGKANNIGIIGFIDKGTLYGLVLNNINISGNNGAGMFGTVQGTSDSYTNIYGIRANYVTINGTTNVGGLIGFIGNYSDIKEIELDNITITGDSQIGGMFGNIEISTSSVSNILIKNGSVDADVKYVGLVSSLRTSDFKNVIVENVSLEGSPAVTTDPTYSSYHSNDVIVNNTKVTDGFDPKGINDINLYEAAGLDTWIGADDIETGYYFDYDSNNKVILKSVKKDPFPNSEKILSNGSGTKDDPYLVKNESDWKKITAYVDKVSIYIKLDSNLDFSSKKYYMLGSSHNQFNGTLIGNDKTISNVTINASKPGNIGMIGVVNCGTIYGLVLNHITIKGGNGTGIFGYVVGASNSYVNIYGIRANYVTINGITNIGGLIGFIGHYSDIKEIELDNINVSGVDQVGGLFGNIESTTSIVSNILIKKGNVKATWRYVGLVSSLNNAHFKNAIVENVTLEGSPVATTNSSYSSYHSTNSYASGGFDPSNIDNIYYYKNALETLFTGDANNTGYFFDLTDDGKIHLVKAYTLIPPTTEDTGENIGPDTGVCSRYSCTCECGCICNDDSDGATQTRCEAGCN